MREETFYKVLWVEDDLSIIQGYQIIAESKDIELDVATNWEEAEEKLRINFKEYSAIILDAQCKIKKWCVNTYLIGGEYGSKVEQFQNGNYAE